MGPGLGPDPMIQQNVAMLRENGVTVIGYVYVNEGAEFLKHDMKNWKNWYPQLEGFYLAGVTRTDGQESLFTDLVKYAKDYLETKFVVVEFRSGNTDNPSYIPKMLAINSNVNLFVNYNGRGLPAPISALRRGIEEAKLEPHQIALICTKIPTSAVGQRMAQNFIGSAIAENVARYFYLHTDSGARDIIPEPFTFVSEYLEAIVRQLDAIAAGEAVLPIPPPPAEPTEFHAPNAELGVILKESDRKTVESTPIDKMLDKFGVKKIYPDMGAAKFQEWYFQQEGDPTKDTRLQNWKDITLRRMQDGSKDTFFVGSGKEDGRIWLKALSVPNKQWLNTESTIFFKYLGDNPKGRIKSPYAAQLFARVNTEKEDSSYAAAVFKEDGRTTVRKQITPDMFVGNRATQPAVTAHPVKGNWVGFKQVVFSWKEDGEPNTYVVIETYICQNITAKDGRLIMNNQDWKLTSKFVDRGFWGADNAYEEKVVSKLKAKSLDEGKKKNSKARQSTDIINNPGVNFNAFGVDGSGVEMVITNWSVREIYPGQRD